MKKINLLICGILASISLQATIRIISTTPTTPATASCNGSIYVEASGTAGPFRLVVSNGSGVVYQAPMNGTTETVAGLCSGAYTVQVFNAFGCAKTLLTEVSAGAGNLSALPQQNNLKNQLVPTVLQAKAYPNPFDTDFQVELDWDRAQGESIDVQVLNALGQVVQTQRRDVVLGRNVFTIEMNDPASRGFLQVILRDKSGRQVWLKVMQVRN